MKKIFSIFVLTWLSLSFASPAHAANKWMNLSTSFIDGDAVLFNDIDTNINNYVLEPLNRLLINSRAGMALAYNSASAITVTSGSVVCSNSAGTINEIRRNTSNTSVSFSDIDAGGEASSTTYYIFASCDADATTAAFKVSASGTAPTGVTYYKKLGSFYNDSSSNIDSSRIYPAAYEAAFTDSSGVAYGQLGSWVQKSWNTTYQAATDGFVVCYAAVDNGDSFTIVTDSSSSPSTVRQSIGTGSGTTGFSGSMASPVKKNDYYKCSIVSGAVGSSDMYFIPMGY